MASIEKLITLKTERLESVPDAFLTRLERVQKQVFPQVMDLMELLERDSKGTILLSDKNLRLLATIQSQLRDVLLTSDYKEFTDEFVSEFETQSLLTDEYLKEVFTDFAVVTEAQSLVTLSQRSALDLFLNGVTDEAFADAIYKQLELAVSNNASFADTVREIQKIVTGDAETDGKILQYAKQVAHDSFALSDRSYTSAMSEQLEAEWFLYAGNVIKTSREFCEVRHNHYYYYKEIESWSAEDWDGKIQGTNEKTIFTTAGGWNCRHSIIPVSINIVPRKVILDAMANWGFVPSKFEKEELEL